VGRVLVQASFEGIDPFEEDEELVAHARRGLLPIRGYNAKSLWKRWGIKPVVHDAPSSWALSVSQNGRHVSCNVREQGQVHVVYPVINYKATAG
jgi:hypothetical protein